MADTPLTSAQVTDALTQVDVATLGNAAVVAVAQAYLASSQANCVLFANMVHAQQQTAMASHVSTVEAVNKTLGKVSGGGRIADDGLGGGGGGDKASSQEIAEAVRSSLEKSGGFGGSGPAGLSVW
jgi:hypothetical protein